MTTKDQEEVIRDACPYLKKHLHIFNDLNAIKTIKDYCIVTQQQKVDYLNQLRRVLSRSTKEQISDYMAMNARADEHIEAILKAIKRWDN